MVQNDDYHYEQEIYGSSDVPHTRLNNSASSYVRASLVLSHTFNLMLRYSNLASSFLARRGRPVSDIYTASTCNVTYIRWSLVEVPPSRSPPIFTPYRVSQNRSSTSTLSRSRSNHPCAQEGNPASFNVRLLGR